MRDAAKPVACRPPPREDRLLWRLVNRAFPAWPRASGWVARWLPRAGRAIVYVAVAAATWWCTSACHLLPAQRRPGTGLVNVQLPPGAARERTLAVMSRLKASCSNMPEVQSMVVVGFSFPAKGRTAALGFVTPQALERAPWHRAARAGVLVARPSRRSARSATHLIFPVSPPPIPDLGRVGQWLCLPAAGPGPHPRRCCWPHADHCWRRPPKPLLTVQVVPTASPDASSCSSTSIGEGPGAGHFHRSHQRGAGHLAGVGYVGDFPAGACSVWVVGRGTCHACSPEDLLQLTGDEQQRQPVPLVVSFASTRQVTRPADHPPQRLPAIRIAGSAAPWA